MKRTLLLTLMLCLFLASNAQEGNLIKATIANPAGLDITFSFLKSPFELKPTEQKVKLDDGGSFQTYLSLQGPAEVTYSDGRNNIVLYLEPNQPLTLNYDSRSFVETLTFEGKSRQARINQYFLERFKLHENWGAKTRFFEMIEQGDPEVFWQAVMEDHNQRLALIDLYRSDKGLPRDFAQKMETLEACHLGNMLLTFPRLYTLYHAEPAEDLGLDEAFFQPAYKVELAGESKGMLTFGVFRDYLNHRVSHLAQQRSRNRDDIYQLRFEIAPELLEGQDLLWAQGSAILDGCNYGLASSVSDAWATFKLIPGVPKPFLKTIGQRYDKMMTLAPGQPAPEFALRSIEGGLISLKSLEGKVVYLDFWASWCKPCLREMPFSKELKEEFAEEDVVFVYVSLDEDSDSWLKMTERLNLGSNSLHAGNFDSDMADDYAVESIPNYFLIGRDGLIIHPNPPRPSEPELRTILEDALD